MRKLNFGVRLLLCLAALSYTAAAQDARPGAAPAAQEKSRPGPDKKAPHPADVVEGFPAVKWGMSFQEARQAVEKTGLSARGFGQTELYWDATFHGTTGEARVAFREDGAYEMALMLTGAEQPLPLAGAWRKRLTEKYGKVSEEVADDIAVSLLWRLEGGFAVELRRAAEGVSPIPSVHWVQTAPADAPPAKPPAPERR